MRHIRLPIAALTMLAGTFSLQAHEFDPGGTIVVTCHAGGAARMADVARAIDESHYWAPQSTRREMLTLARQACASGSTVVTFVPPLDRRYGANNRVALGQVRDPRQG